MALKDQIPIDLSEDIVGLTASVNCLLITLIFETQVSRWSTLLIDVANVSKFGVPPNMATAVKKSSRNALLFFAYAVFAVSTYSVVSVFVESVRCDKLNKEKGLREICYTITPFWWPYGFKEFNPLFYLLINAHQYITLMLWYPVAAMIIFIAVEAVAIIKAKIEHMQELFEETFATEDFSLQRKRMGICIRYHQEIIRLGTEMNVLFKKLFGQMSFLSAVVVSFICNQILRQYSIGATLHLIGYWAGICFICHIGQNVSDDTYSVKDRAYSCKWYLNDPKLAKDLQLVILRSQKPVYMESIPFGNFSYSILITIIKTAYSYLTLINNTG
ncbi:unnamed protein product [Ceutorhynchus assimilis]|uniref:Odorant receptor n=1 Tax=Ceutorhynchus assimilis TaxID=467358 RepID=A0A9N9QC98_9CUCU|nr:unnamed protein product [Ceutorhynchus assimilis]